MADPLDHPSDLLSPNDLDAVLCVRVDRAMRILGIGRTKLYELIANDEIETVRIGRRTLVLRASIENFVERLRRQHD